MHSGSDASRSSSRVQRHLLRRLPADQPPTNWRETGYHSYERNPVMNHGKIFKRLGRSMFALVALISSSGIFPAGSFAQAPTSTSAVKIGTIGAGNIGSTLGTLWIKSGHPVLFSSRHPEQLKSLVDSLGPLARAGTVTQALAFGDVVLMAVPYGAYP